MRNALSLRVASLCTGIAGFDVGLAATGHHIVQQVEWDDACTKVRRARVLSVRGA